MESLLKQGVKKPASKSSLYSLLAVGSLVFFAGYLYTITQMVSLSSIALQPSGTLYASMAASGMPLGVMSYDVSKQGDSFESQITLEGATVMQFEHTRVQKSFLVFSPIQPDEVTGIRSSNIVLVDGTNKDLRFMLPTASSLTGFRNLDYSEVNGLLTFTAKDSSISGVISRNPESVDVWGIYVVNPTTQVVEYIGEGIDSVWSPDGASLAYLGSDGIKQYMQADKVIRNALMSGFNGEISAGTNMNIDISANGELLAVSSPNDGMLSFLAISTWQPLTLTPSGKYQNISRPDTTFYWPTFSPDNAFIATQVADIDKSATQINPRIEIVRLADMEVVRSIPINQFDFGRAFIDGWQAI